MRLGPAGRNDTNFSVFIGYPFDLREILGSFAVACRKTAPDRDRLQTRASRFSASGNAVLPRSAALDIDPERAAGKSHPRLAGGDLLGQFVDFWVGNIRGVTAQKVDFSVELIGVESH